MVTASFRLVVIIWTCGVNFPSFRTSLRSTQQRPRPDDPDSVQAHDGTHKGHQRTQALSRWDQGRTSVVGVIYHCKIMQNRHSYSWWKKSGVHQLRLVVYPIIWQGFKNIPGGAGFFPSTVFHYPRNWQNNGKYQCDMSKSLFGVICYMRRRSFIQITYIFFTCMPACRSE